jgi:transcriptional regulator with GAF, ATPase, and Fis domain
MTLAGGLDAHQRAIFPPVTESGQRGLAEVFADIARQFEAEASPETTQNRVTQVALTMVDGCDHAGISVVRRRGGVQTVAATDDTAVVVDAIQYETGEGPCLTAIYEHATFLIDDLAEDRRWPAFSRRAVTETGVRSMLSFRLFLQGDTLGALNLYSRRPAAFDERDSAVGTVLAAHAAIAMSAAREHERAQNLEDALQSSREIGMAMGVLMALGRLTQEDAFAQLRSASQHLNRKLREVAADVVETGELPAPPGRSLDA